MASGGDDDLGLDHIGVHAHLRVVVQGHQSPVGDSATHVPAADIVLADDQVLDSGGVEELDVGGLHTPTLHQWLIFAFDGQVRCPHAL